MAYAPKPNTQLVAVAPPGSGEADADLQEGEKQREGAEEPGTEQGKKAAQQQSKSVAQGKGVEESNAVAASGGKNLVLGDGGACREGQTYPKGNDDDFTTRDSVKNEQEERERVVQIKLHQIEATRQASKHAAMQAMQAQMAAHQAQMAAYQAQCMANMQNMMDAEDKMLAENKAALQLQVGLSARAAAALTQSPVPMGVRGPMALWGPAVVSSAGAATPQLSALSEQGEIKPPMTTDPSRCSTLPCFPHLSPKAQPHSHPRQR